MDAIRKKIIADITSTDLTKSSFNINNPSQKDVEIALDGLIGENHTYEYIDSHPQILIDRLLKDKPELSLNNSYSQKNQTDIDPKKKTILPTIISWLVGIFLVIGSLGFLPHSVLSGVAILVAGLLFLPPIHNLILTKANINIHWLMKTVLAFIFMFYGSNISLQNDKKEFQANRDSIITEIKQKITDHDYNGATALATKYEFMTEDEDLKRLNNQATVALEKQLEKERQEKEDEAKKQEKIAKEKAEKQRLEEERLEKIAKEKAEKEKLENEKIALKKQESDLLKKLENTNKTDFDTVLSTYEKLSIGSPDNNEYKAGIKKYKSIKTKALVRNVKKVKSSNLDKNLEIYTTLLKLNPNNKKFKDKVKLYKQKKEEKDNKEKIRMAIMGEKPVKSAWDGTYYAVKNYLKRVANDPDSIDVEECTKVYTSDDGWLVGCNYRGKNAFGGMIRKSNWFTILRGQVVKMHPYSAYNP